MESLAKIAEHTRISYDLAARRYYDLFRDELDGKPFDRKLLDDFSSILGRGAVVHDLGCGPIGHVARYLHAGGLRVIGSDISPRCIAIASTCHPDIEFLVMDMASLALGDRSVDGLVSYYSIIHTPKRLLPGIFREFGRVLRRGGRLLLAVKEGDQEGYLDEFLAFATRIWFTYFRQEEIARFLTDAGFRMLLLERRCPLEGEIRVPRIFAVGEKP